MIHSIVLLLACLPTLLSGTIATAAAGRLEAMSLVTQAAVSDLSGRYEGSLTLAKGGVEPLVAVLVQDGSSLRGSLGPDVRRQNPFTQGSVDTDSARFIVGSLAITLRRIGGRLEGVVTSNNSPTPAGTFVLTRVGELTLEDRFPLLPHEGAARSPRMLAIREAVGRRDFGAVASLWAAVAVHGAPVIEAIPDNDKSVLVTFLWRGRETTKTVLLMRNRFTFSQPDRYFFSNIEGTNVWFKTLRLPRGARFSYSISENDPLSSRPASASLRHAVFDPLNPLRSPESATASLVQLPGAAVADWHVTRADVPGLRLATHRLRSDILANERDIKIYLPPGYTKVGTARATLYLFDGEDPDGLVFASQTIANLIAAGRIPGLVVVRVANPNQSVRSKELACSPQFAAFLNEELIPFVRTNYNVTSDPRRTAIGGYSLGGLGAVCAALRYPGTFGLVMAQSGSFWWESTGADGAEPNEVARLFVNSPTLPLRFDLEAGTFEVDLQGTGGNILETTRHLRDVLRAKGYDVRYVEFVGDHDYMNWRDTMGASLIHLFGHVQTKEQP